jgi:hypothetical protein
MEEIGHGMHDGEGYIPRLDVIQRSSSLERVFVSSATLRVKFEGLILFLYHRTATSPVDRHNRLRYCTRRVRILSY